MTTAQIIQNYRRDPKSVKQGHLYQLKTHMLAGCFVNIKDGAYDHIGIIIEPAKDRDGKHALIRGLGRVRPHDYDRRNLPKV